MKTVRAAMIGDIVGSPGLEILEAKLPLLIKERNIDFVIVNGENAAEGFGMTENDFRRIIAAGVDAVTSGNHIWEKREFWQVLENEKKMLRPANYPAVSATVSAAVPAVPGAGYAFIEKNGVSWLVINLQGRELMNLIDCPFQCFDLIFNTKKEDAQSVILVDFHAESSREKEALAYYIDGRASVIAGTHTHVQTADERILPKGSAYITDLGMTGITDSVIGMDISICQDRFNKQVQYQMKIAASGNPAQISGIIAEIDADTGKALSIQRI
ncbi:MAG: YmdB family metallophosphoesterase [Brevinematales bacterium]|nr:YmdB family metallophosphoesterase [Brevinematales bacterium]